MGRRLAYVPLLNTALSDHEEGEARKRREERGRSRLKEGHMQNPEAGSWGSKCWSQKMAELEQAVPWLGNFPGSLLQFWP